jgi:hypothetical protein
MALLACGCQPSDERHLIPVGYVGPVVIVFGDSSGEKAATDEEGAAEYRIGNDGILRLNSPAPRSGRYLKHYFFVHPDGTMAEIPSEGSEDSLQIFAPVVGATAKIEGRPETPIRWAAYIVGVPSERTDWVEMRSGATEHVLENILGREVTAQ